MPVQATALIVYAESSGLSMDFREIPLAARPLSYSSGSGTRGAATEAIRRDRVKSSRVPLAALGVISPWNPLATLSFHKENSAIAEGLVPLRVPGLD